MSDFWGYGEPTTCEVCHEPSLPLKHAEILCKRHAAEAGYLDPEDCPHENVYFEKADWSVGLGEVHFCEDCRTSLI